MASTPFLAIMPPATPPANGYSATDQPAQTRPEVLPPPRNLSLHQLEQDLMCLLDTAELVEPERQAEFAADLEAALATTIAKRDRIQGFLVHVEGLIASVVPEIKRFQARKAFFESVVERVELSVVRTIRNLGADAKGKYKTLQGDTVTLSVRRCPATVSILDEAAVPAEFKSITITLPALAWEAALDALDIETRAKLLDDVKRPDVMVNKALVKDAIEASAPAGWRDRLKEEGALPVRSENIPGAAIIPGALSLVRK